jgi:hypothetical protein
VADGLVLGLADGRFDLRYRCSQALLRLTAQNASLALPRDRILEATLVEAENAPRSPRHLDCAFLLLQLLLPGEPLAAALRALRDGSDALRGTALEYLENVVPARLRERLWPHVGGDRRPARSGRTPDEIRDELLRSTSALGPPPSPAEADE